MQRIQKHLHVKPKLHSFNLDHLDTHQKGIVHHSKNFWKYDKGYHATVSRMTDEKLRNDFLMYVGLLHHGHPAVH